MGYVKSINELYTYDKDIYNLMEYIFGPGKYATGIYGTYNVFGDPFIRPDIIAEQFIYVNKNRPIKKRLHHIVFSFDNVLDEATPTIGKQIGDTLIRLYPDYQAVYGLHTKLKEALYSLYGEPTYTEQTGLEDVNLSKTEDVISSMLNGAGGFAEIWISNDMSAILLTCEAIEGTIRPTLLYCQDVNDLGTLIEQMNTVNTNGL